MFRNVYYIYCNILNALNFKRKHARVAKDVRVFGKVRLCGNGVLDVKNNVRIVSDWRANPIGGEYTVFNLVGGGY